jgi:hypothetical protein
VIDEDLRPQKKRAKVSKVDQERKRRIDEVTKEEKAKMEKQSREKKRKEKNKVLACLFLFGSDRKPEKLARKRTAKGNVVMKHVIGGLLEKIQKEKKGTIF